MKITFPGIPNQRQPGCLHWFAGSQCLSPARSGEATFLTTLDRTTIDLYSYARGPSETKIGRRRKTEAPRAFAPARRSGKHPAHCQLFRPFLLTGVRSTGHHIAAI